MVALAAATAPVPLAGAGFAAGLAEVCGLKKSASVFFAGEGDGLTTGEAAAVVFAFRPRLAVGEGEASVPAAGDAVASAFLCVRCFVGDAAGDPVGEGD
jgi:hypothetical protein